jgi:adenine-specific DNA-methyltransferase
MPNPTPVPRGTPDITAERLAQLRDLFPEAFSEDQVDFDKLRASLGDLVDEQRERYSFTWAGKTNAIRILQTPTRATLIPCPEQSLDFDTTQNLFIEGDNLEVLKLLYKPYFGRVKMIYIDPPYNTGNDFVYPDNYADPLDTYLKLTGQRDAEGNLLTTNPETSGRYHSAWLSMMYPRLFLARQLLREDGVIFVSIDDNEVHNLRMLMNEVFGEENLVEQIVWKNKYGAGALTTGLANVHEYILCYSRSAITNLEAPLSDDEIRKYKNRDAKFATRGGYVTQPLATTSKDDRPNLRYAVHHEGHEIWPEKQWVWAKDRFDAAYANDEIVIAESRSGSTT